MNGASHNTKEIAIVLCKLGEQSTQKNPVQVAMHVPVQPKPESWRHRNGKAYVTYWQMRECGFEIYEAGNLVIVHQRDTKFFDIKQS